MVGTAVTQHWHTQVALSKFVDDFSNLAVEKCLLVPLSCVFSSSIVDSMPNDVVTKIAHEDEDTIVERKRLKNKLAVLDKSLRRLQQLDKYNLTGESPVWNNFHSRAERAKVHEHPTRRKTQKNKMASYCRKMITNMQKHMMIISCRLDQWVQEREAEPRATWFVWKLGGTDFVVGVEVEEEAQRCFLVRVG